MQNAAKRKSISPPALTTLWTILLLVVTLCLGQTRVWGFAVTPQPASGVFAPANPLSIGENYDGCPYDASDSLLAAKAGGRTVADTLPKGITDIKNAQGGVFKSVHTPPSAPHAGMEFHTHPNYRKVLPDGTPRSGVSKSAKEMSRKDIIDAVRPGDQRTGGQ